MKSLTLDAFKALVKSDNSFKEKITNTSDVIDLDNGSMTIHKDNINRYLEKYACKSQEDLENTLWFSYGIFVRVVE